MSGIIAQIPRTNVRIRHQTRRGRLSAKRKGIKTATNAPIATTADTGMGDPINVVITKHKFANSQLAMRQIGKINLSIVVSN